MKEPLVGFKTAKLAKKKGFPQTFLHFQYINLKKSKWKLYSSTDADELDNSIGIGESIRCSAPTQSLLQKWLRETHNIHIGITLASDYELNILIPYVYEIYIYKNGIYHVNREFYDTYEQALESGLFQSLNLVET